MSLLLLGLVALQSAAEVRQIVSFHVEALRTAPFAGEIDGCTAKSTQGILAPVRELSVR